MGARLQLRVHVRGNGLLVRPDRNISISDLNEQTTIGDIHKCLQEISMNGDHLTIMHTGRCQDCNANGEQPKSASVKTPDALCKACNDTHYVTRFLKPDQKIGECGLGLGNRSDDADNSAVSCGPSKLCTGTQSRTATDSREA